MTPPSGRSIAAVPLDPQFDIIVAAVREAPTWPAAAKLIAALTRRLDREPPDSSLGPAISVLEDAVVALLSPPSDRAGFHLDMTAFELPRLLAAWRVPPTKLAYWRAQHIQLSASPVQSESDAATANRLIALLLCETILKTPTEALATLIGRIDAMGPARFWSGLPNAAAVLTMAIRRAGCLTGDAALMRRALAPMTDIVRKSDTKTLAFWVLIILRALFVEGTPEAALDAMFELFVIPVLQRAADNLDQALLDATQVLDERINSDYVKQTESSARFERIQRSAAPLLEKIGRSARTLTEPASSEPTVSLSARPRVGFVLGTDSRLAHAENLVTLLRGIAATVASAIEPFVYIMAPTPPDSSMVRRIEAIGTPVRAPETGALHPVIWLARATKSDRVSTVVFVSSSAYVAFAAGYHAAAVVVWWTMKYHVKAVANVDGYLSPGTFFDTKIAVRNEQWRGCRAALPLLTDPAAGAEGLALRAKLGWTGDHTVLGCIGREEKLLDPEYMATIATILMRFPSARFMWTGRAARAGDVQRLIDRRGIGEQCAFIGWVKNTKAAVAAIDIYVDSFPFASGHTCYEAMAAGKAVVILRSPEALESSVLTNLIPAYEGAIGESHHQAEVRAIYTAENGECLLPAVATASDYAAMVGRLIDDLGLRRAVGQACQRFVERFARDEATFAATTCQHLLDLIREKAQQSGK